MAEVISYWVGVTIVSSALVLPILFILTVLLCWWLNSVTEGDRLGDTLIRKMLDCKVLRVSWFYNRPRDRITPTMGFIIFVFFLINIISWGVKIRTYVPNYDGMELLEFVHWSGLFFSEYLTTPTIFILVVVLLHKSSKVGYKKGKKLAKILKTLEEK